MEYRIPNLPDFDVLSSDRSNLEKTISSLNLKTGQRYVSVGIGTNILPFMIALHGVDVVGFEIERECVEYQAMLREKYGPLLKEVRGSIDVINFNIDSDPICEMPRDFDIVECVNFQRKYDNNRELGDTILSLGVPNAKYLLSLFGGPESEDNQLVKAVQLAAANTGRMLKVLKSNLYVSRGYNYPASLLGD